MENQSDPSGLYRASESSDAVATSAKRDDARARAPSFETAQFRRALGQFATGVTVITALDASGVPIGFTASSFNSVSLEPPLVLWSIGLVAGSLPVFTQARHYAINVLSSDQLDLSQKFSSRSASVSDDRFAGVAWRRGASGVPLIDGCCAWFECFNRSRYEEGDHVIFVGEVERCGLEVNEPLIFQDGLYHMTQPHPGNSGA